MKKNTGVFLSTFAISGMILHAMPNNPPIQPSPQMPQTGGGLMAPAKPTPVAMPYPQSIPSTPPQTPLSLGQPSMQVSALKKIDDIVTEIKNKISQPGQDIATIVMQQADAIAATPDKSKIKKDLDQAKADQEAELAKATEQYNKNFNAGKFNPQNWGEFLTSVKRINIASTLLDAINTFEKKIQ